MRLVPGLAVGLAGVGLALAGGCTADKVATTDAEPTTRSSTAPPPGTTSVASTVDSTNSIPPVTSTLARPTTTATGPPVPVTTAPATTAGTITLAPPAARLSGNWTGTWTAQDGTSGALQITWTQQGNVLHGALTMEGAPCPGGVVNGSIGGLAVLFAVNNRGEAVETGRTRAGRDALRHLHV